MDTNSLINLIYEVQDQLWDDKVNVTPRAGCLCQRVSTFHPSKLPCQLEGTFHHGALNAGMKMVFSDSTAWVVRFPRAGMVSDNYADEKVAVEETITVLVSSEIGLLFLFREYKRGFFLSINTLGLALFIMEFIDGVSLSEFCRTPRPSALADS